MARNEMVFLFAFFALLFGVPLILSLNAMGRRVREDYRSGDPQRIASITDLKRRLLVRAGMIILLTLVMRQWMVAAVCVLMGVALLSPIWLNHPYFTGDD